MKINEVEALVGITKKNIRFYEEQRLVSPKRNSENSYRDYGEEEVRVLRRIKLLRKLGVPIEEIRNMINGIHTVSDGMRRHLITLEREERNLRQSVLLCQQIRDMDIPIGEMDAESILRQMEELEQGGAAFRNKQVQDIRRRYIAPVAIAAIVVTLMVCLSGLLLSLHKIYPQDAPPIWLLWIVIGLFAMVGCGVILALWQRIQEIGKGEIDDAKRY